MLPLILACFSSLLIGVRSGCHEEVIHSVQEYCNADQQIKFLVYNIQVFGVSKMDKPEVVEKLLKTLPNYDIIMIQEVRDSSDTAIHELRKLLNDKPLPVECWAMEGGAEQVNPSEETYQMVIGARQGGSTSKEQIAFFYKPTLVSVIKMMDWVDTTGSFERPPFIVHFKTVQETASVKDFVVAGTHIKPSEVVAELDALYDIYPQIAAEFGTEEIMLTGDFNAGCGYLSKTKKLALKIWQDAKFKWLVGDEVDTTVAGAADEPCPYDRVIVTGNTFKREVRNCVGVYDDWLVGDSVVSDHYPVSCDIM